MKRILFLLMLLPIMAMANVNLGIKKADEFIVIPLLTLDSAGVDRAPDSIQILTWLDGGTALQFSASNTTYPFDGISIDTSKIFADTTYWLVEQIQDIDGSPTPQNYSLAIDVITWTKQIAFHNRGYVQVISDSLEVWMDSTLANIIDAGFDAGKFAAGAIDANAIATNAIGAAEIAADAITFSELATSAVDEIADGVWNEDSTGHTGAGTFGREIKSTSADVINIDGSSIPTAIEIADEVSDSIFFVTFEDIDGVAGSVGDSMQGWGATAAGGTDTLNIKTMMERNFTSASGGDGWANMIADSNWGISALTSFGAGSIGDSAIGGINTWGQGGVALGAADIVAIADTIFSRDSSDVNAGAATSYGTLMMKPAYISDSGVTNRIVGNTVWGFNTITSSIVNQREVDIQAISDNTAADLELLEAFDGDGVAGGRITLVETVTTVTGGATSANQTLIIDSLQAVLDSLQRFTKQQTDSLQAVLDSIQLQDDIHVLIRDTAYATIDTLQRFTKPATDTLQGIIDTLQLQDNIHVLIRDSVYASLDTLQRFTKQQTDSLQAVLDSLQLTAITNLKEAFDGDGVGSAMRITKLEIIPSGDDTAIVVRASGAGLSSVGVYVTGNEGLILDSDNTDASDFVGNFDSTDFIATYFDRIFDGTWDELQAGHTTGNTFGKFLDTTISSRATAAGGGLDTLKTTFVDSLLRRITDSIWLSLFVDRDGVAGSFGDSAQGWGATAAGGDHSPSGWDATDSAIVRAAVADTGTLLVWEGSNPTGGYIDSIVEGDGTGSFIYKAVDTVNDIAVQFVSITAYNTAGNILGIPKLTDGSGQTVWGFTVGDTIIFQTAENSGFTWEQDDSIITVTNGGIDSTMGFGPSIGTPSGGNECRVFGFAYDVIDTADAMQNVWAVIELVGVANNTCDSTITVPRQKMKLTDAAGQFTFDVVRSSCLSDTDYRIWLEWEGGKSSIHVFPAPDLATFKLLW